MKKMFVSTCAVFLATAFVAAAAEDVRDTKQATSAELKSGTVKRLDAVAKTATVETTTREGTPLSGPAANESVVCWDNMTKIEGGPLKEGDLVHFKTASKDGTGCATWIHVGKMDTKPKAQAQ